ncbi:MAG: DUF3667 domain-containing protein [Bacteroidia bacterium]|nr:DUF3667 domain-containing protein [Bacteroidia bacterium]
MKKTNLSHCPNCNEPYGPSDNYCGNCGQKNVSLKTPFWDLVREVVGSIFNLESNYIQTIFALFRPGFLTQNYHAMKRKRYTDPLRFYLFVSVLFFLGINYANRQNLDSMNESMHEQFSVENVTSDDTTKVGGILSFDWGSAGDSTKQEFRELAQLDPISIKSFEEYFAAKGEERDWLELRVVLFLVKFFSGNMDYKAQVLLILDGVSKAFFFLMPIFALILKLLYIRRGFYYSEHFIFALHIHSFIFLLLILCFGIKFYIYNWFFLNILPVLAIPVYIFLSMRRIYGQSKRKTLFKFLILGLSYFLCFIAAVGLTTFFTIIS